MTSHLSTEDRWTIIALHKHTNCSQSKISTLIKCNQSTVSHTIKRYEDTGGVEEYKGRGKKPLVDITDNNNNT